MRAPTAFAATMIVITTTSFDSRAADTEEQQRAVILFDKGRKLARDGRCSEAIAPLLESIRYAEGVGPLLNLGACYETLGKMASAYKYFSRAQEVAAARDDKRRDEALQRAKSVERDVSVLIVHVPASIRDVAEVRVDGESLMKDKWDTPTPVDPGPHEIEVIAPPHPKQSETVNVRGKGDRVEWTAPVPVAGASSSSSTTVKPGRPKDDVDDDNTGGSQRTLGYVVAGAGLVGLTLGGVFGVISLSAHSSVTGRCPTYPRCPASDKASLDSMNNDAIQAGTVATIAVVAGVVLLIGGAALYFTAPSKRGASASSSSIRVLSGGGFAF